MLNNYLIIGLVPYLLLLLNWLRGIQRLGIISNSSKRGINQACSIVIAFRNEQNQLGKLVESLKAQNLDRNQLEVLFIDDHSEDDGFNLLKEVCLNNKRFHLHKLENGKGKKAAIRKGVELAKHELIITTDADCRFNEDWASTLLTNFVAQKLDFLTAPVSFYGNSFWSKLFNIEQGALMAATAGSIGNSNGFICNGANMMFRKADYLKLSSKDLKAELASGDDVFLLHALKKLKGKHARFSFLKDRKATVRTGFPDSLHLFIEQRLRWAKKSKAYDDRDAWVQSAILVSASLLQLFALVLFLMNYISLSHLLFVFLLKYLGDIVLLSAVKPWFKLKGLFPNSILLAILYPLYSLLIAFLSLFYHPKWKGRKA